jgi:hypothetical protein
MNGLSTFEISQVVNMTVQSILLLATFLGALYVGVKQYQINKQLIELQHQPSLEVAATPDQIQVLNKGNTSVWLWGTEVEHSPKTVETEPRLITPQGFYYIPLAALCENVRARVGPTGQERLTFLLFIKTADGRKYVIRNLLLCIAQEGHVSIRSQTIAIDQQEWLFM